MRRIKILNFGYLEYERGWKLQRLLIEKCIENRKNGINESYLMLCEHFPVYTIGKAGVSAHFKSSRSPLIPAYRVERGGDVTWHGLGQLVAYPIFDLTHFRKDLHW
jgi:lipoyl(octanoyl) transferase